MDVPFEFEPKHRPHFLDPPKQKYQCVNCNNILLPPIKSSTCGHRFCSPCVQSLSKNEPVQCPVNLESCDIIRTTELQPDIFTTKQLMRLKVCCKNECGYKDTWKNVFIHEQKCVREIEHKKNNYPSTSCLKQVDPCGPENEEIAQNKAKNDGDKRKGSNKDKKKNEYFQRFLKLTNGNVPSCVQVIDFDEINWNICLRSTCPHCKDVKSFERFLEEKSEKYLDYKIKITYTGKIVHFMPSQIGGPSEIKLGINISRGSVILCVRRDKWTPEISSNDFEKLFDPIDTINPDIGMPKYCTIGMLGHDLKTNKPFILTCGHGIRQICDGPVTFLTAVQEPCQSSNAEMNQSEKKLKFIGSSNGYDVLCYEGVFEYGEETQPHHVDAALIEVDQALLRTGKLHFADGFSLYDDDIKLLEGRSITLIGCVSGERQGKIKETNILSLPSKGGHRQGIFSIVLADCEKQNYENICTKGDSGSLVIYEDPNTKQQLVVGMVLMGHYEKEDDSRDPIPLTFCVTLGATMAFFERKYGIRFEMTKPNLPRKSKTISKLYKKLQALRGRSIKMVTNDDSYMCPHCESILKPPVKVTPCGHRLCDICSVELFENGPKQCPGKEEDCVRVHQNELIDDYGANRDIMDQKVYCLRSTVECGQIVSFKYLPDHIESCQPITNERRYLDAVPISMESQDSYEVNHGGYPQNIDLHHDRKIELVEPSAKYRCCKCKQVLTSPVKRTTCGHWICSACSQNLELQICPQDEIDCVYTSSELLSDDLAKDEEMLSLKVFCGNRIVGCNETMPFKDLSTHYACCEYRSVICTNVKCNKIKVAKYLSEHILHCEFTELRCSGCKSLTQITNIPNMHCRSCENFPTFDQAEGQHINEGDEVENEGCNLQHRVSDLEAQVQRLQSRLDDSRNDDRMSKKWKLERAEMEGNPYEVISQLKKRCVMLEEKLTEYAQQIHSQSNNDGMLLWKIKDYSKWKQAAIEGRTLSLYSQPFYSSRYGYKMCARVYLNGDGTGKETHMSLFFVVMKGEYDPILPWPFRHRVIMTLLDTRGGQRHITDSFRPDPNSSSFRRPLNDMNIASGSPLFVSQKILEENQYVDNDTIFIKIQVVDDSV